MTEAELYGRAKQLARRVREAKFPALVPAVAKGAILEAAELVEELAKREAIRCQEQKTTEKQ